MTDNQNKAPASAVEQAKPSLQARPTDLTGKTFTHFQRNPAGSLTTYSVRTGTVVGAIGTDHFVLEFHAEGYRFSNVFPSKQLEMFVFFDSPDAQQAFLADLTAQSLQLPPKTNAGRGHAGTRL